MKPRELFEIIGNGTMYILTASQTKEIFEIVSLVLSILISVLIIISKIIQWWKSASSDGKITKEELKEGLGIIKDGAEEIKEHLQKGEKEDDTEAKT